MSYCRWSSVLPDGFESDLYIYDHVEGFISVNVAGSRLEGVENAPGLDAHETWTEESIRLYVDRKKWLRDHEKDLRRVAIGLPHDGQSFSFEDPSSCVLFLKELKEMGYRMPEHVLDVDSYEEWP